MRRIRFQLNLAQNIAKQKRTRVTHSIFEHENNNQSPFNTIRLTLKLPTDNDRIGAKFGRSQKFALKIKSTVNKIDEQFSSYFGGKSSDRVWDINRRFADDGCDQPAGRNYHINHSTILKTALSLFFPW